MKGSGKLNDENGFRRWGWKECIPQHLGANQVRQATVGTRWRRGGLHPVAVVVPPPQPPESAVQRAERRSQKKRKKPLLTLNRLCEHLAWAFLFILDSVSTKFLEHKSPFQQDPSRLSGTVLHFTADIQHSSVVEMLAVLPCLPLGSVQPFFATSAQNPARKLHSKTPRLLHLPLHDG